MYLYRRRFLPLKRMTLRILIKRAAICTSLIAVFWSALTEISAKETWMQVDSGHFRVIGNTGEKDLRQVAVKLEQFRIILSNVFDRMNFDSPVPLRVIVFKDDGGFKKFKPVDNGKLRDWVAGYFQPGEDVNYIVLSAGDSWESTYRIIFHEYTHLLLNNTIGQSSIPPWFNEGMAEYYEIFEIQDERNIRLGGLNDGHLKLLKEKKLIPLEKFFAINLLNLNGQSDDEVSLYYAQSWALVHFLIHGNGGSRKSEINSFLELLMSGKSAQAAFDEIFGADFRGLERELEGYLSQTKFSTASVALKKELVIETPPKTTLLSEAEAKGVQADLLFRLERLAEAEVLAKESLNLNPGLSMANSVIGLLRMNAGDYAAARYYLKRAVNSDQNDFRAHYNYALAISREGVTDDGHVLSYNPAAVVEMRRSLNRVVSLNPDFAEAYNLLAFINIVNNSDLEDALTLLERALELSPMNQWYSLRIGEVYLRQKRFEDARIVVRRILEQPGDDDIREFAETSLQKIDESEKQTEKIRVFNEQNAIRNPYLIESAASMTPAELDALQRRIEIDSINTNIRQLKSGEERVLGNIVKIECVSGGVVFKVRTGSLEIELKNRDFNDITFYTYNVDLKGGQIGCGSDVAKSLSIITFRPPNSPGVDSKGSLVAVEFVPEYFTFSNENKVRN